MDLNNLQEQIDTLKQQMIKLAEGCDANFKRQKEINILYADQLTYIEDEILSKKFTKEELSKEIVARFKELENARSV